MQSHLDKFFSAMSDPTRRAVVEQLVSGRASVSALHEGHDIALPTFLRHIQVLQEAGLIRTAKKGRIRTCQLNPQPLFEAQGWLAWQRTIWDQRENHKD